VSVLHKKLFFFSYVAKTLLYSYLKTFLTSYHIHRVLHNEKGSSVYFPRQEKKSQMCVFFDLVHNIGGNSSERNGCQKKAMCLEVVQCLNAKMSSVGFEIPFFLNTGNVPSKSPCLNLVF